MTMTRPEKTLTVASDAVITALDTCVKSGVLAHSEQSSFKRTLMVATSIGELRNLLTPKVMEPIMHLQNSSLGFKTDQPNGYALDVVRDCLIEACLKGVYPVGNEFNIIAKQCYITKEGFGHKLRDIPGLSYTITPGIPKAHGENGAVIAMLVEWSYGGKNHSKELQVPVRVNRMMGVDAIIGKATRKARAWLYTTVTGQELGDGEVDGGVVIDVENSDGKKKESPFESTPTEEAEDIPELNHMQMQQ